VHLDNVFNRRYYDAVSVIKTWVSQPGRGVRLNYEIQY
jgi:outer membrane receptor protein involved in Fe transport